jgi:hypothetical protein
VLKTDSGTFQRTGMQFVPLHRLAVVYSDKAGNVLTVGENFDDNWKMTVALVEVSTVELRTLGHVG